MKKEYNFIKRFRLLTQMLIISGALNIVFLCSFVYLIFLKGRPVADFAVKPVILEHKKRELTNNQYISYLSSLSLKEIIPILSNKEMVEDGYLKRDLALGCLFSFKDFDLEKALPNHSLQKREFSFVKGNEKCDLTLFAGLSDAEYESIMHYATTTTWPFTSRGLFNALKKSEKPRDATLEKACMLSEEFYVISNLFQGSIAPEELLDLFTESSFDFIEDFVKKQNLILDLSHERKLQFLISSLTQNSKTAASLLLKTDLTFAAKRLSDDQILKILSLLGDNKEVENFCILLLKSARSDLIWKGAAAKLYDLAKEKAPENFDQKEVMKRFVKEDFRPKEEIKIKKEEKSTLSSIVFGENQTSFHIVKDGENLWKIARKYRVDIDELIRVNKLEKSTIYPGKKIIIPKKH